MLFRSVRGMWMMLQQDAPDDYVMGTGVGHTVLDFVNAAYAYVGKRPRYQLDERQIRPLEVDALVADYSKAKRQLGWEPLLSFEDLVADVMRSELERATLAKAA